MNNKERNILLKAISDRKKISLKSKGNAIAHLHKIGILTKSGNKSSFYY